MEKIIEVKNLTKTFKDVKAVDEISFDVYQGELFGFLGVNGAGKSTTINMLSTMYEQNHGIIRVCGMDNKKSKSEIRKKIGVVFQNNTLDERLTVEENLLCRGYMYENSKESVKTKIKDVCELLEMDTLLPRRFKELSGGQKRRCEIARAVMNRPQILFLDEPTTGLDPQNRKLVWNSIETLMKKEGLTVFLTTHYMEEAAQANHIGVMNQGKLVALEQPYQLKKQYASDYIRFIPTQDSDKYDIYALLENEGFHYKVTGNDVKVKLEKTLDAIPLLARLKEKLASFEVVQGNLDDVFLNITGQSLEGDF